MNPKSLPLIVFIFLLIIVIIVVVGLGYNPAPCEKKSSCKPKTHTDLLGERLKNKPQVYESAMTPPYRNQISPQSVPSTGPWGLLNKLREEREERENKSKSPIVCLD